MHYSLLNSSALSMVTTSGTYVRFRNASNLKQVAHCMHKLFQHYDIFIVASAGPHS
jgi:ABC-type tungstate transport system permease subunit